MKTHFLGWGWGMRQGQSMLRAIRVCLWYVHVPGCMHVPAPTKTLERSRFSKRDTKYLELTRTYFHPLSMPPYFEDADGKNSCFNYKYTRQVKKNQMIFLSVVVSRSNILPIGEGQSCKDSDFLIFVNFIKNA